MWVRVCARDRLRQSKTTFYFLTILQIQICVPNSSVGAIIGAGGSNIKQIIRDSNAFVTIEPKRDDDPNFFVTLNDFKDTVFGNNLIICRDIFLPYREEKCQDKSLKYCNKYCTWKSKCHDTFEVRANQKAQAFRYVMTMLIPITSGSRNPNSFRCNCSKRSIHMHCLRSVRINSL